MNIRPLYSSKELYSIAKANPDFKEMLEVHDRWGVCEEEFLDNLEARITQSKTSLAIKVHSDVYINSFGLQYKNCYTFNEYWANVIGEDGLNRFEVIHEVTGPRCFEFFKKDVLDFDPQAEVECIGTVRNLTGILGYTKKCRPEEGSIPLLTKEEATNKFADFLLSTPAQEKEIIRLAEENYDAMFKDLREVLDSFSKRHPE